MKKMIPFIIVLLTVLIFIKVYRFIPLAAVMDDGYAVTADLSRELVDKAEKDRRDKLDLQSVHYEDVLYQRGGSYYVGEGNKKQKIEMNFPLYVLDGGGLRFLSGQSFTITQEFEYLPTYDGLYLVNGFTYNVDKSQADLEEFNFVLLPNGLFINALPMEVKTSLGTFKVEANSIMNLEQTTIRYYYYSKGMLGYRQIDNMSQATVTIGQKTYDYLELLRLLNLISEKGLSNPGVPGSLTEKEILNVPVDEVISEGGNRQSLDGKNLQESLQEIDQTTAAVAESREYSTQQNNSEKKPLEVDKEAKTEMLEGGLGELSGGGEGDAGDKGGSDGKGQDGSGSNGDGGNSPATPSEPERPPVELIPYVKIHKVNTKGESLPGAKFNLYKRMGEKPDINTDPLLRQGIKTDKSGEIWIYDLTDGNYYFKETEAPEGYVLRTGSFNFSMTQDAPQIELTIKNYTEEEGGGGGTEDPGGGDSGPEDPDPGEPPENVYEMPVVTVSDFEPWVYAAHTKVKIKDPDGYISKGIKFTVYKKKEDSNGKIVYSTVLRQTVEKEGDVNIGVLPPDSELYIEGSFRYYTENATRETHIFMEKEKNSFNTLPIKNYLEPVQITNDGEGATAIWPTQVMMSGLRVYNTTDYDKDDTSFDNFKKNTLPYIAKAVIQASEDGGTTYIDAGRLTSGALMTLLSGDEVDFLSDIKVKLKTQTDYDCRLVFYDKFNQEIPTEPSTLSWKARTCKGLPVGNGTVSSNVTGNAQLEISVRDDDDAIVSKGGNGYFQINYNDEPVSISGTLDGEKFYNQTQLEISSGGSHSVAITNLLFSKRYQYQIKADYDLSDGMGIQRASVIGGGSLTTAPIANGVVYMENTMTTVRGTEAAFSLKLLDQTSVNVLPLLTSFEVTTKPASQDGRICKINMVDLINKTADDYNNITGSILIQEMDELRSQPRIEVTGRLADFEGVNAWQAVLDKKVSLLITYPEGSLPQSTKHAITVRSLIEQSGEEYEIPTTVNKNTFTTLKRTPELEQQDMLLVNDFAEIYGLKVKDVDGVIINGSVTLKLKIAGTSTILDVKKIKSETPYEMLRFDYLVPGTNYELEVIADEYNVGSTYSTYQTNVVFRTISFTGGSKLKGITELSSLTQGVSSAGEVLSNGTVVSGTLGKNGEIKSSPDMMVSDFIEYDPFTSYVMEKATGSANTQSSIICFYDKDKTYLSQTENNFSRDSYVVSQKLSNEKTEAAYLRYTFPEERQNTASIKRYQAVSDNLITAEMTKTGYSYGYNTAGVKITGNTTDFIPITEGGTYFRKGTGDSNGRAYVSFFSDEKLYLETTINAYQGEVLRAPKAASYMTITYTRGQEGSLGIYEMGESNPGQSYQGSIHVRLEDGGNYLVTRPDYKLRIRQSESYRNIQYTVEPGDIEDGFDGEGDPVKVMEKVHILKDLDADAAYEIGLIVTYRGHEILLHTLTFQTDDIFDVIETERDLQKVERNPGGNYLVTKDLELTKNWNLKLRGTIDFDGHQVTASSGVLFEQISSTAVVKNINLVLPAERGKTNSFRLATDNQGKISNLICTMTGAEATRDSIIYTNSGKGVIDNFVFVIDSSIIIANNSSLFVRTNSGTIENGYYYITKNGKAEVLQNLGESYVRGSSILLYMNRGVVRNIYGVGDFYLNSKSGADTAAVCARNFGTLSGIYVRGDYFTVTDNEGAKRSGAVRLINGDTMERVYYVSEYEYTAPAGIKAGTLTSLFDTTWQGNVLNRSNFEIQQSVTMGFYPRLKLPACLQFKQPYIQLPILLPGNTIRILDAEVTQSTPSMVDISLSIENPSAYKITGLDVTGAACTVLEQSQRDQISTVKIRLNNPTAYVSSYPITRLYYNNGNSNLMLNVSFQLQADFYKEISTVNDWTNINNQPTWNYRLVNDIDFSTTSLPGYIMIDKTFQGKLDGARYKDGTPTGELYALRGITLNQKDPYVFAYINGGNVKNLLIDNLTLKGKEGTSKIGFCSKINGRGSSLQLDNVHIRNSVIEGSGTMGALVSSSAGNIANCSVANTTITDQTGSVQPLALGGLVGSVMNSNLTNCYVKGITIKSVYSQTVEGVGGLVGLISDGSDSKDAQVYNCYSEGTIESTLNNVGGIIGYQRGNGSGGGYGGTIKNCWSQMEITTKGSVTGGITGKYDAGSISNVASLGSINSAGTDTYRIAANPSAYGYYTRAYAYEGQLFNGASKGRMDATAMIAAQDIIRPKYWQDEMCFGGEFDYSQTTESILPRLYHTDDAGGERYLLYGQEDVYVQGLGYDVTLSQAMYGGNPARYQAEFQVIHENVDRKDLKFQVVIDGIGESGVPFTVENGGITISYQDSDPDKTILTVRSSEYYKAFDAYNATVHIQKAGSETWQRYGLSVTYYQAADPAQPYITYWDVSNLTQWNAYMDAHGQEQENFKIKALINLNGTPAYTALRLGRLEGDDKATCGFTNIKQNSMRDGELVWIEMASVVKNLKFSDYMLNFSTPQSSTRNNTGLLSSVFSVENVDISNGKIVLNKGAATNAGFFGRVAGNIDNVTVTGASITATNPEETSGLVCNNVGILCGYLEGTINNCKITGTDQNKIVIDLPTGSNMGGMVGYQNVVYAETGDKKNENLIVNQVSISGRSSLGGIIGRMTPGRSYGILDSKADNVEISLRGSSGGGMVGSMGGTIKDSTVSNVKVIQAEKWLFPNSTLGNGGGICGNSNLLDVSILNCTASNITIDVSQAAGGLTGGGNNTIQGSKVVDSTITARGVGDKEMTLGNNAGGLGGTVVKIANSSVHNTKITARNSAGGLAGSTYIKLNGSVNQCYVSSDTTVTSAVNAGGLLGWSSSNYRIQNTACGATVTATGDNAGGLVGTFAMGNPNSNNAAFNQVYFVGKVKAKSHAGGMFGRITEDVNADAPNLIIDPEKVQKILIAGDIAITSPTGLVSTWANGNSAVSDIGSVGYLRVWVDSKLITGEGDQSVVETGASLSKYMPKKFSDAQVAKYMKGALVDTKMLETSVFYSGVDYQAGQMGFTSSMWSYDSLKSNKMPYVTSETIPVDNGTGIPIPIGATVLTRMRAAADSSLCLPYPSGIDTLNLELADVIADEEGWMLTVEAGQYKSEEIPVTQKTYTMEYDFKTPVRLLLENQSESYEVIVDPTAMRRTVMTDGTGHYYITPTGIEGSASIKGEYIHLMDGQALTMDGVMTDLNGETEDRINCEFRVLEQARSFMEANVNGTDVQSFGSYTEIASGANAVRRDSRILIKNGEVYSLPKQEPMYADSFILDHYQEDVYFSYLTQGGGLVDMETPLVVPEGFQRRGIDHISNNINSDIPVVLVRYKSGEVTGFNYLTGESLGELEGLDHGNEGESTGFLDYATDFISGVTSGFSMVSGEKSPYSGVSYETAETFSSVLKRAVEQDADLEQQLDDGWEMNEFADQEETEDRLEERDHGKDVPDKDTTDKDGPDKEKSKSEKTSEEKSSGKPLENGIEKGAGSALGGVEAGNQDSGSSVGGQNSAREEAVKGGVAAQKGVAVQEDGLPPQASVAPELKVSPEGDKAEGGKAETPKGADTASDKGDHTDGESAESGKEALNPEKAEAEKAKAKKSGAEKTVEKKIDVKSRYMVAFNGNTGYYEVYDSQDFFDPEYVLPVSENEKIENLKKKGININLDSGYMRQTNSPETNQGLAILVILAISVSGLVVVLYYKGKKKES